MKALIKTTSTKTLVLISLFAGLFVATNTIASDDLFAALDTNQDEVIDMQEASAHETLSAVFIEIDANGDGVISRDEFAALEK